MTTFLLVFIQVNNRLDEGTSHSASIFNYLLGREQLLTAYDYSLGSYHFSYLMTVQILIKIELKIESVDTYVYTPKELQLLLTN